MPQTLLDYWNAEQSRAEAAIARNKARQVAAAATESAARDAVALAAAASQAAQTTLTECRAALAAIPMPSDGDPLLARMRQALIDLRGAATEQVRTEAALRAAMGQSQALRDASSALAASLATTIAEVARARLTTAERKAWAAKVRSPPVSDLPQVAATALATSGAAATAKVSADFPKNAAAAKDFLTAARNRRNLVRAELALRDTVLGAARTAQKDWIEATKRKSDLVPALDEANRSAADELHRVADSKAAVDAAIALLQQIANRPGHIISDAELLALTTTDKAAREAALALLNTLTTKQVVAGQKSADYTIALNAARIADPSKTDAELGAADAALQAKADAAAAAAVDVVTATNAIAGNGGDALRAWFAAVPDTLWSALENVDAAVELLNGVKSGKKPADYASDWETAEEALVTALQARDTEAAQAFTRLATLDESARSARDGATLALPRVGAVIRFVQPA